MAAPDFYIEGIPVYKRFMNPSQSNYPAYPMKPEFITVHQTANQDVGADAEMHSRYLLNEAWGRQASWHFTVDDHQIYWHAPLDRSCWHGGDGEGPGNRKSIGIETCENRDGNFKKATANVQALIRWVMVQTKIMLSKVEPHRRWSGKNCPHDLLPIWSTFMNGIQNQKASVPSAIPVPAKPAPTPNESTSIIDYLNSRGIDSSMDNRKIIAKEYNISNYSGSAEQNLELLSKMRKGGPSRAVEGQHSDNKTYSIVDYLNQQKKDSSFPARAKLAAQYGIKNYSGSADQNIKLLNALQSGKKPQTTTAAKTTAKPAASQTKTLILPSSSSSWRVYPLNKAPTKGNEKGFLNPKKFGGLSYKILANPQKDVYTIQTSDFGKVNIYAAPSTGAKIK